MRKRITLLLMLLLCISVYSQKAQKLKGSIIDATTMRPLSGVSVVLNGHGKAVITDDKGEFTFRDVPVGDRVLTISSTQISNIHVPVLVNEAKNVNLGEIKVNVLQSESNVRDMSSVLASLEGDMTGDDSEFSDQSISTLALLSSDPYLSATGYQLSQARFRPRGYKQKYEQTYLSGVSFNDQIRGQFNYSMLGAMNDMTRNGDVLNYMQPGRYTFGDIGGSQDLNLRAGNYAKGAKATLSYTNRNYKFRGMASYNTGLMDNGWAFSALIGGRYADEGVIEGTFYNNVSYFLSAEKQWDGGKQSFSITTFGSPVQRAQASASVQEAYDLLDNNYYNSYWGYQDGKKRNSRIVTAYDPSVVMSYIIKFDRKTSLTTGLGLRYSRYGSTALSWFKSAEDPRPDYYRKLPSYYTKGEEALSLLSPNDLDEYWKTLASHNSVWMNNDTKYTQIDWDKLYYANKGSNDENDPKLASAAYLIEERRNDQLQGSFNSNFETKWTDDITFNAGVGFQKTKGMTYSLVNDLLGANFHLDIDKYGERDFPNDPNVMQNDMNNPNKQAKEGDKFGYDYNMHVNSANLWLQNQHQYNRFDFYYGAKLAYTSFQREGKMRNGRDPENSYGKGKNHEFVDWGAKAGFTVKLDGRNFIVANASYKTQAPTPYDAYVSPRISDNQVLGLESEKMWSVDFGYVFSLPTIKGRVSVFQTNFYDQTQKASYFHDGYRTFVHHVLTNVDKTHKGIELGLEWKATQSIKVNLAGTVSEYYYANNPTGTIKYENNAEPEDVLPQEPVYIKNFYVGPSPQLAGTLGATYFYKFWWFGVNLNGFAQNYLDPSPIQRTESAVDNLIPDYADSPDYNSTVQKLVKQKKLNNALTLDLSISKLLYLKGGKRLSFNFNLSNILNNKDLQTGGFEQGRLDVTNLDKFPPKYYYMQGINCFLNVGYNF